MITLNDFKKVEIRVATIIEVNDFTEAKNPSYKLKIDFGKFGIKKSSAQITRLCKEEDLLNKQIIAITNFKPKQIANFISECLVLGVILKNKEVVLLQPEGNITNGYKVA